MTHSPENQPEQSETKAHMSSRPIPRKAMILAAGLGTRMRPLTLTRPKPLLPLGGKPIIDHILDRLAAAGVEEVVVNLHYLAPLLRNHLSHRHRPHIHFSDETELLLDTGGGIRKALPLLGPDPFFVLNGDSLWLDESGHVLARMAEAWRDETMDGLLLLADPARSLGYDGPGDCALSPEGRIQRWQADSDKVHYPFAGISLLHPRLFQDSPDGPFSLLQLWDRAERKGHLYGLRPPGFWLHLGTPEALSAAEAALAAGDFRAFGL